MTTRVKRLYVQSTRSGKPVLKMTREQDCHLVGVCYEFVSKGLVIVRPLREVQ